MKVIITMAGEGSRFKKIGILKPKYEIVANGKTLFEWSMSGLSNFFKTSEFIFVTRANSSSFISQKAKVLKISNFSILEIDALTSGQAETVYMAIQKYKDDFAILVFNIDTYLNISPSDLNEETFGCADGWLQLFKAPGDHWSFAKLNDCGEVIEVTEKIKISDFASTGLYYFKSSHGFKKIFETYQNIVKTRYKETYIAPFFQHMLELGQKVTQRTVPFERVIPLGTPEEVARFDKDYLKGIQ